MNADYDDGQHQTIRDYLLQHEYILCAVVQDNNSINSTEMELDGAAHRHWPPIHVEEKLNYSGCTTIQRRE